MTTECPIFWNTHVFTLHENCENCTAPRSRSKFLELKELSLICLFKIFFQMIILLQAYLAVF